MALEGGALIWSKMWRMEPWNFRSAASRGEAAATSESFPFLSCSNLADEMSCSEEGVTTIKV